MSKLLPGGLLAFLVVLTANGVVQAAEFTLDSATAVTFTLNDDDSLTITTDGSITTVANYEHGVDASGDTHTTIVNNGMITTNGSGANGVFGSASDYMSMINNGTIATTGASGSYGVYLKKSHHSTIVNFGTVTVAAEGSRGLAIEETLDGSITNYGYIEVSGERGGAMIDKYSDNGILTNFGTILAKGWGGGGMILGDSAGSRLDNHGTITTEGDVSDGMYADVGLNSTMSNTGTIRTSGVEANGMGVYDSTRVSVSNTGSVISEHSYAFMFDDVAYDSELNLSTKGYIGGGIHFDQPLTINLATGASNSVLWDFSDGTIAGGGPSISGDVPWFYNATTSQFATYDPSIFAGMLEELGDMTSLLSRTSQNMLGKNGAWLSGIGGRRSYAGDGSVTLGRDIEQYGMAFGYSDEAGEDTRWNVMGGYLSSRMGIDGDMARSYDGDGTSFFVGAKGRRDLGVIALDGGVTGGLTRQHGSRFINDNLALTDGLTLGEGGAEAEYVSIFLSPELQVSAEIALPEGWALTPAAGMRYATKWTGGFTETGSSANATLDDLALGVLETNAELSVSKSFGFGLISAQLGYQIRQSTGDKSAEMTLVDTSGSVGVSNGDSQTAYAGFDLALDPAPNVRLTVDARGYFDHILTGGQASAALAVAF